MSDKEKNKNLENRTSNPQNNAGSFPNQNNNGKNLFFLYIVLKIIKKKLNIKTI